MKSKTASAPDTKKSQTLLSSGFTHHGAVIRVADHLGPSPLPNNGGPSIGEISHKKLLLLRERCPRYYKNDHVQRDAKSPSDHLDLCQRKVGYLPYGLLVCRLF